MTAPARRKRVQASLTQAQKKTLALRLYAQILEKYSSFERFKKALRTAGARTSEGTVRGWMPHFELLRQDPIEGSKVEERQWKELQTPKLPQLVEVSAILGVSVDWLLGGSVAPPLKDFASSLKEHLEAHCTAEKGDMPRLSALANVLGGRLARRSIRGRPPRGSKRTAATHRLTVEVDRATAVLDTVSGMVLDRVRKEEARQLRESLERMEAHLTKQLQENLPDARKFDELSNPKKIEWAEGVFDALNQYRSATTPELLIDVDALALE